MAGVGFCLIVLQCLLRARLRSGRKLWELKMCVGEWLWTFSHALQIGRRGQVRPFCSI